MKTERDRVIKYIAPLLRGNVNTESVADEIMERVQQYNRRGPGNVVNGEIAGEDSLSGNPISFSV